MSLFFLVVAPLGCASMNDVIRSKEMGTSEVYPLKVDQAWMAAITVFRWEGAETIEEQREQNYMLTSSGKNGMSGGTFMGAWIEPVDDQNTKVTVVTKRRLAIDITTTLTESTFHKRYAQAVEILKSGKGLPLEAPREAPSEVAGPGL